MQATLDCVEVVGSRRRFGGTTVAPAIWDFARGWEATIVLAAMGALLGGFLGGASLLYAWVFARKVVLDESLSTYRRVGTGLLAVASAIVLYSVGLSIFQLLLPS